MENLLRLGWRRGKCRNCGLSLKGKNAEEIEACSPGRGFAGRLSSPCRHECQPVGFGSAYIHAALESDCAWNKRGDAEYGLAACALSEYDAGLLVESSDAV